MLTATISYIALVAIAAALGSLAPLWLAIIVFAFALVPAFRHELRAWSPSIPHSG